MTEYCPQRIPVGVYGAKFVAVSTVQNDIGKALLLKFQIAAGTLRGRVATRICSATLSPKSNLLRFAASLNGGRLAPGVTLDLLSLIGVRGLISVELTSRGATRVAAFVRVATWAKKKNP